MSTIFRRAAAVQRTLEAKHPARAWLGALLDERRPASVAARPGPIYAEIVGTTARIIDSKASQVLWRGEFWADGPKRATSDCSVWAPWSIALWWDPRTRHVLAMQEYRTGGCMCPDVPVETVQQMR